VCVLQRNILEDPARGYLRDDTIIIKYTIELVVTTGGALSRNQHPNKGDLIKMPLPTLGRDLGELFRTGEGQRQGVPAGIPELHQAHVSNMIIHC
jgi:hypothetical protein